MTFDQTLDAVMKLDYDSKELLIELVYEVIMLNIGTHDDVY